MNIPNDTELPTHIMNIMRLPKLGTTIKLSANDLQLAAFAAHFELMSLERFQAQLKFKPWIKDGVQVGGNVEAMLYSQCPVTLQPVAQRIQAAIAAKFVPENSKLAKPKLNEEGEMVLEFDADDIPDVFSGEELDAWAIACEYLALEIDPFLRADGAKFDFNSSTEMSDQPAPSPFSKLEALKSKS